MARRYKLMGAGFLFMGALVFQAAPESLGLEEIIMLARDNNPELLEVQNTLRAAENDLVGDLRIGNTSLKASEGWDYIDDNSFQGGDSMTGTLTLTVPVIDQLSLSASLDTDQDVSAEITLEPLNMTNTTVQSRITLDNARIDALYTQAALDWEVLDLALNLALADKNARLAQDLEVLENQQYQASYALYLAGDITYEDLLTAMDDLTDAEDESLTYSSALIDASQDLWTYLSHYEDNGLKELALDDVEALADSLLSLTASLEVSPTVPQEVSQARNGLISAERELDTTLKIHPDLSISTEVSGNLADPDDTAAELTISLTLSGDSFNATEREILASEVKVKQAELNQALFESEMERESLTSAMNQAEKARESAVRDRERKQILADETALLYEQGERTVLEKTEADLDLEESENKLFQRYIEEIAAAADYLSLYPESGIDLLEIF